MGSLKKYVKICKKKQKRLELEENCFHLWSVTQESHIWFPRYTYIIIHVFRIANIKLPPMWGLN